MPLMNHLDARAVATLEAGKYNDGAPHKRKMAVLNSFTVIPFTGAVAKWV